MRFIKVNELKITQVELLAAYAFELFCMAYLANIGRFSMPLPLILSMKFYMHVNSTSLSKQKSTQLQEVAFYSFPRENARSHT